jgi:oxygen-dependent protoporphyrinogen oxidase
MGVAVVGSGVAGMAVAFRLQQAGFEVRVFEAGDYAGGRTQTLHRDGFVINQGATVLWSGYESLFGIIEEAGLGADLLPGGGVLGFVRAPDDIVCIDSAHMLRDGLRFPLSHASRLLLLKLGADVARRRRQLDFADPAGLAEHDVETAEQYTRRCLNEEILEKIVRPAVMSLVTVPASVASNTDLFFSIARFMGIGNTWHALRNGMGSYAEHLSRRFEVSLRTRVDAVEEAGGEVRVTSTQVGEAQRTDRFAACVIAVPAHAAAAIHQTLSPARRAFLEEVPYSAMCTVSFALSAPLPAGNPAALLIHPEDASIFTAVFEHNKNPRGVPAGKGLVGLYPGHALAVQMRELDDDAVIERVLREGEKILPRISDHVEFAVVRHWNPGAFHSRLGYYRDLARFHEEGCRSDVLVRHAGDYFAPSSMNTASASGERAARDIVAALGG